MKYDSVFVVGGTGYVGSHFVARAAELFSRVVVPLRSHQNKQHDRVETVEYDGSSQELCKLVVKFRPDIVVNCAAFGIRPDERNLEALWETNSDLPESLYAAADQIDARLFLHLGSCAELSRLEEGIPVDEEYEEDPFTEYGRSKLRGLERLRSAANDSQLPCTVLRLFGVYGPNEATHRLTSQLVQAGLHNSPLALSDGLQVRDFVYIEDVVSAMMSACQRETPRSGIVELFNIGSGTAQTVQGFAVDLFRAFNFDRSLLRFGEIPRRETDQAYLVANIEKAVNNLGWFPEHLDGSGLKLMADVIENRRIAQL